MPTAVDDPSRRRGGVRSRSCRRDAARGRQIADHHSVIELRARDARGATASVRFAAPSLPEIDATWNFTVWSLMPSRAAIALFGSPSASSSSTCTSRGVSGSSKPSSSSASALRVGRDEDRVARRSPTRAPPRAVELARDVHRSVQPAIAAARARTASRRAARASVRCRSRLQILRWLSPSNLQLIDRPLADGDRQLGDVPPRSTFSATALPTRSPSSRSSSSSGDSIGWPSNSSSTSPTSTPAAAAGLPLVTPTTSSACSRPSRAALILRQRDRLARDAEIAALQAAVLEHGRRGLPRDRRRDDDAEAANRRGGRDADQPAGGVEERAAGEAVVHRRGRADHLIDRAAPAGRQRSADHRDDAGAGGDDVAPRARDGEREMADARGRGATARAAASRGRARAAPRGSSSDPSRRAPRRACGRRRAARAGRLRGRARARSSAPRCRRTRARWPAGGGPAPGRRTATRRSTASAS